VFRPYYVPRVPALPANARSTTVGDLAKRTAAVRRHTAVALLVMLVEASSMMPVLAVLTLEVHIEHSHSLKDKRHVVKGLKDRLRSRFNVAVAEIDGMDSWQRSVIAAVTVSNDRTHAEKVLQTVENDAANVLGSMLVSTGLEFV